MKITKAATSVIEAMIIMLIIVTGVVGMYNIYIESVRLSETTAQRLQAMQIAREGVEAIENIRNTNWILFAADYGNCWNTIGYDNRCIGDSDNSENTDIAIGSYIVYQDPDEKRWFLEEKTDTYVNFSEYIDIYEVGRVDNFHTQSGSFTSLTPNFTREIIIDYPNDPETDMSVKSLVQWVGPGAIPHKVELDLVLTNWKNKD